MTMKHCRYLSALLAAIAAPAAVAAPQLYQIAGAGGSYYSDEGVVQNTTSGQHFTTTDGSHFRFSTCVGSEPGLPGCSVSGDPPPPNEPWY